MQLQNESTEYAEINVTPMVDLYLVMLIIFIIMCTAGVQGLKINLPKASTSTSLSKPKTRSVTVSDDGKIFLDTIPVSLPELEQKLKQAKAQDSDFPVVLRGDSHVQYQSVMDVLDLLGRIQLTQVGLVTKTNK